MTEQEWLKCSDPRLMLAFLEGKVSDRKLLLFTESCRNRIWNYLSYEKASKYAVLDIETAARFGYLDSSEFSLVDLNAAEASL